MIAGLVHVALDWVGYDDFNIVRFAFVNIVHSANLLDTVLDWDTDCDDINNDTNDDGSYITPILMAW